MLHARFTGNCSMTKRPHCCHRRFQQKLCQCSVHFVAKAACKMTSYYTIQLKNVKDSAILTIDMKKSRKKTTAKNTKGRRTRMPRRQSLFWDVDSKTIDPDKHARYVIERILDFGNDSEVRWALHYYPAKKIKQTIQKERSQLHPKSIALWSRLFL